MEREEVGAGGREEGGRREGGKGRARCFGFGHVSFETVFLRPMQGREGSW